MQNIGIGLEKMSNVKGGKGTTQVYLMLAEVFPKLLLFQTRKGLTEFSTDRRLKVIVGNVTGVRAYVLISRVSRPILNKHIEGTKSMAEAGSSDLLSVTT